MYSIDEHCILNRKVIFNKANIDVINKSKVFNAEVMKDVFEDIYNNKEEKLKKIKETLNKYNFKNEIIFCVETNYENLLSHLENEKSYR